MIKKTCLYNRIKNLKKDNSGVAMIVSLIVGIVVLGFALSLLMVTYSLYAQMNRKTIGLQCKLLAQNFSEVLGKELKDDESELVAYLSEQMSAGNWISVEEAMSDSVPVGTVSKLVLDMTDDSLGSYRIQVVFTYTLNEDNEDDDDAPEDDDQVDVDDPSGDNPGGSGDDDPNGRPTSGMYNVTAEIKCYKGSLNENDTQSYIVIVSEYRSIGL